MKRFLAFSGLTLFVLIGAVGEASDQPAKEEKKIAFFCPVAGMPEAKNCCCPGGYCPLKPTPRFTGDYKGCKLQFCCGQCEKVMKQTPGKFSAVANHQLVATGQAAQIACPNCGGVYTVTQVIGDVAGIKVRFCLEKCHKHVVDANAKDRVEMVFGDKAFAKGFEVISKK